LYYQRCPISQTVAKPPAAWYGGACAYIYNIIIKIIYR
jgi:hypothetical protein